VQAASSARVVALGRLLGGLLIAGLLAKSREHFSPGEPQSAAILREAGYTKQTERNCREADNLQKRNSPVERLPK
jgi:hypothetical protein